PAVQRADGACLGPQVRAAGHHHQRVAAHPADADPGLSTHGRPQIPRTNCTGGGLSEEVATARRPPGTLLRIENQPAIVLRPRYVRTDVRRQQPAYAL